MDSFTGKLAVVTGGGSGMGRELRQLLAQLEGAFKDKAPSREPKGAAPTGLTSDEGARREGGASRAPGGERENRVPVT
jgi:NAD(P)-dependent dehydrogenase (short-subunit alcohol dehydrogenase family)